eukprot:CAMPEP_0177764464 /NCGR_PEP_ID=MMETSP0491_2-20121128/7418_1 /TAXON_ID=63592 /ORGANISM="Tetraselmis chuii, Strain PLY429" /LENGTH=244 /DNA_ID=CAMNT_0019280639 /DNA_START=289 /DNA_END=1023 /DNA_ORIENTATION=+
MPATVLSSSAAVARTAAAGRLSSRVSTSCSAKLGRVTPRNASLHIAFSEQSFARGAALTAKRADTRRVASRAQSTPVQAYGRQIDVCIVLGSRSDLPIAEKCVKVMKDFGIRYELRIASAHRAPKYLESIVGAAEADGCKVFIGMAGVAAALPGVLASMTGRPVIGVPCGGKVPYDSLLSIVQMPPGMPVATVGTDRGDNAGVLAVQILATSDPGLAHRFSAYRTDMTEKVIADDRATTAEYGM